MKQQNRSFALLLVAVSLLLSGCHTHQVQSQTGHTVQTTEQTAFIVPKQKVTIYRIH